MLKDIGRGIQPFQQEKKNLCGKIFQVNYQHKLCGNQDEFHRLPLRKIMLQGIVEFHLI